MGHKLGYFAIEKVDELFLAKTFLFLTMQGTPEAGALYKLLRLKRLDVEHLGLDSLNSFLSDDLRADHELVSVLEECGFGGLLQMARFETKSGARTALARDVRAYLGMQPKLQASAVVPA
jgi:hypothetical protein